jgi:hypothetical protein
MQGAPEAWFGRLPQASLGFDSSAQRHAQRRQGCHGMADSRLSQAKATLLLGRLSAQKILAANECKTVDTLHAWLWAAW